MTTARAHDSHAQQATAHEVEAARWAAAGRPDHAAHLYAATLERRPGDTRVRMMLADCLVRSHQPQAAASEYLRVALDYAALRRDPETMALCYQVLHLDASQLVYVAVADVLRRIGREARGLCARTAEAHLQAGRLADGLHMLRLGAEIDARNPDVRRRLAQIYLGQHMIREAVTNLAEAGRLLLAAGNNAAYIELAEQILAHDPRHLETLRELPRVYLRVGEAQRAVVKLADLMRVSPGDTIGYETLAHAFAVIGRVPTALSVLERLVGELRSSGRAPQAETILERARGWRIDDVEFVRAVVALGEPQRAALPPKPRAPRPTTTTIEGTEGTGGTVGTEGTVGTVGTGGTVVLDLGDLLEAQAEAQATPLLDLSEDVVEIADGMGTVVLRVQDLSRVGPAPGRRPPSPPPAPRRRPAPPVGAVAPARPATTPARSATTPSRTATTPARPATTPSRAGTTPARVATTPSRVATPPALPAPPAIRPAAPPSRAGAVRRPAPPRPPLAREVEATQALDLSDLELDDVTLVRRLNQGDMTALVIDEDSAELREDPRSAAARAAMVQRARELARHA